MLPEVPTRQLRARYERLPPVARQFAAYGTIGAFTTSLDAGLFGAAVALFDLREGVAPTLASTTSYMIAAALAYVLNSRIAFREQHRGDSAETLLRFGLTFASSALLAAGVFALAHTLLGSSRPELLVAKGMAIATIIVWNFSFLRLWVFRAPAAPGAEPAAGEGG